MKLSFLIYIPLFIACFLSGFPLELKFQITAGFAKNTLVKTFGFHLNVLYACLSLGTGLFCKTSNIGKNRNSVGDAPALPLFTMGLVRRSRVLYEPKGISVWHEELSQQVLSQVEKVKEKRLN